MNLDYYYSLIFNLFFKQFKLQKRWKFSKVRHFVFIGQNCISMLHTIATSSLFNNLFEFFFLPSNVEISCHKKNILFKIFTFICKKIEAIKLILLWKKNSWKKTLEISYYPLKARPSFYSMQKRTTVSNIGSTRKACVSNGNWRNEGIWGSECKWQEIRKRRGKQSRNVYTARV